MMILNVAEVRIYSEGYEEAILKLSPVSTEKFFLQV
jgi:hypothetical protein